MAEKIDSNIEKKIYSSSSSMEIEIFQALPKIKISDLSKEWKDVIVKEFNSDLEKFRKNNIKAKTIDDIEKIIINAKLRVLAWDKIFSNDKILLVMDLFDSWNCNSTRYLSENYALLIDKIDHETISYIKTNLKYPLSILERKKLLKTEILEFEKPMRNVKIFYTHWCNQESKLEVIDWYNTTAHGITRKRIKKEEKPIITKEDKIEKKVESMEITQEAKKILDSKITPQEKIKEKIEKKIINKEATKTANAIETVIGHEKDQQKQRCQYHETEKALYFCQTCNIFFCSIRSCYNKHLAGTYIKINGEIKKHSPEPINQAKEFLLKQAEYLQLKSEDRLLEFNPNIEENIEEKEE